MTDSPTASQIIQALAEYLKRDTATITVDHHLRDDLGLDSMAVIELLYKIEETFNIQIPDEDLVALQSVGSVAAYVQGRLEPATATPRPTGRLTASAARKSASPTRSRKKTAIRAKTASVSKPKKKAR